VSFDERMRRAFAGVETSAGFEARLLARIAALPAVPADERRARAERLRARARRILVREAWINAATAAGIGIAAIALVWRQGPAVARWIEDAMAAAADPGQLMMVAVVALAAGLWPVLKRLLPR
jgi:hypothetical protein